VFHGAKAKVEDQNYKPLMYSRVSYYFWLALALFWATSIPYSRFLMGVHSLDQIVYGSTLGVWSALTMHLLVRDNLIRHTERILSHNRKKSEIQNIISLNDINSNNGDQIN